MVTLEDLKFRCGLMSCADMQALTKCEGEALIAIIEELSKRLDPRDYIGHTIIECGLKDLK